MTSMSLTLSSRWHPWRLRRHLDDIHVIDTVIRRHKCHQQWHLDDVLLSIRSSRWHSCRRHLYLDDSHVVDTTIKTPTLIIFFQNYTYILVLQYCINIVFLWRHHISDILLLSDIMQYIYIIIAIILLVSNVLKIFLNVIKFFLSHVTLLLFRK